MAKKWAALVCKDCMSLPMAGDISPAILVPSLLIANLIKIIYIMNIDEFIKYVCDQYRDIFKNNYQEGRAKASAERLLAINGDNPDKAKEAADAIISYTKDKVQTAEKNGQKIDFDDAEQKLPPRWVFKVGDHEVDIVDTEKILIDGEEYAIKTDISKPFEEVLRETQKAVEKELLKKRHKILEQSPERLAKLKEMVKSAPKEVLHSFNEVVNYFSEQISLEDLAAKIATHKKITVGEGEFDLIKAFVQQGGVIVVIYDNDKRTYLNQVEAQELLDKGSTPDGKIKLQIKK